jgi:hypothetical protein
MYTYRFNRHAAALLFVLALAPTLAHAELDCIVPTREEGYDAKRPGADAVRRAARAAAEITQKNAVFMAGNKPVRVRTSIAYGGGDRLAASVITTAYNQKAWLAGGCKISKFSDRGGGLSDGRIAIYINDPDAMLGGQLGDAELRASFAPVPKGSIAGFPVYAAGGNDDDPRVLLSAGDYRPWRAVTVAELLEWQQREVEKREAEFARAGLCRGAVRRAEDRRDVPEHAEDRSGRRGEDAREDAGVAAEDARRRRPAERPGE